MAELAAGRPEALELRLAEPHEASLVHAVMADAFSEYRETGIPTGAFDETEEYVAGLLKEGTELAGLCFLDGQAVGSVRFCHKGEGLYFRRLAVRRAYQGRGIAKALLSWLEEYAREAGEACVWCRVRANIPRNVELYRSVGYASGPELLFTRDDGSRVTLFEMHKALPENDGGGEAVG